MIEYVYPLIQKVILGSPSKHELIIEPDIQIDVNRVFCTVPTSSMFIVEDSAYFLKHDPFGMTALPIKTRKFVLDKNQFKRLNLTYTGYCPPGYCCGWDYLFQYNFVGTRVE